MNERPDYVKCIAMGDGSPPFSWCGRVIAMTFHFQDVTHAALNGHQQGRLVACTECVDVITTALRNGAE